MEVLRYCLWSWFSLSNLMTMLFLSLFSSPSVLGATVIPFKLNVLCKFCDVLPSSCNSTGICSSQCNITAICADPDEVCVAIWRTYGQNMTEETICHNPSIPLYGVSLDDYSNSQCQMKQYKQLGPDAYMCSCKGDECNEQLIFTPETTELVRGIVGAGSPVLTGAERGLEGQAEPEDSRDPTRKEFVTSGSDSAPSKTGNLLFKDGAKKTTKPGPASIQEELIELQKEVLQLQKQKLKLEIQKLKKEKLNADTNYSAKHNYFR